MHKNILFISDSSITNPILRSQGFPLLKHLSTQGFSCFLLAFENCKDQNQEEIDRIFKELSSFCTVMTQTFRPWGFSPGWMQIYLYGFAAALKIALTRNIRIIHARSFIPASIAISLKLLLFGKAKVIYDFRGVFIDEQVYAGLWKSTSWKVRMARWVESICVTHSDTIVAVSHPLRDHVKQRFSSDTNDLTMKIVVIANKTRVGNIVDRLKPIFKADSPVIGIFSGSAAAWQQPLKLAELMNVGIDYFPNLNFQIVTYQDSKKFRTCIPDNSIYLERITILSADPQEVPRHLSSAHFGILLRDDHLVNRVASPIKFAEYLSNGLPVLLSENIGDTEEIIRKHCVGIIIRNHDYRRALSEMLELLRDRSIHERCVDVANREFNIEDAFKDYRNIYLKLAGTYPNK